MGSVNPKSAALLPLFVLIWVGNKALRNKGDGENQPAPRTVCSRMPLLIRINPESRAFTKELQCFL